MEPAPIRAGAIRPDGRPPRAPAPGPARFVVRLVVRLAALAGLAFAGWVAFSALHGTANAAQHDAPDQDAATAATAVTRQVGAAGPLSAAERVADRAIGDRPVQRLSDQVEQIGDEPLRYLRERQRDVLDGKDQVVRGLEELTDAAGVPLVRLPDVRRTPVVGVVSGVVRDDVAPAPSVAAEAPTRQHERSTQGSGKAASDDVAGARADLGAALSGTFAGDAGRTNPGDCAGCRGDRHEDQPGDQPGDQHGPALPKGQNERGGGSGGGHQLSPIADLTSGRYPTVPAALDPNTFHRTALTDVSAPGGPSVVPD
ncbi:hypothetical protein BZB76_1315 [Actinomadura pelletieri DSM 43383]|uniref:Uncharacterized protein n=1 Tax=Actinomadura pelletieri DSM 43383 TaxID=1120940 RepID=A0A495R142_9ACTN|nr:hypothetical protein [Actinomadura pelletieri]RKS79836.1 hypothetical protein BZB76_1315 [Actinomadura pelletieri DSM 43383]